MPRFSARLRWNLEPNPIAIALAAKRAEGVEVLDLTESNPTRAGLAMPSADLAAAFSNPGLGSYDPAPFGLESARRAVADFHGGGIDTSRIVLTASTSEAYAFLFKLLTDPGDEVLIPRPSYPLFEFLAGLELAKVVPYPLVYESGWRIDFEALEELVNKRTRAIVLVNPNNPTGSFLRRSELDPLLDFCRRCDLAIISDEVFASYAYDLNRAIVPSLLDAPGVLTFCLSGLSKVAGLPQMKLAWMIASGLEPACSHALAHLELIADSYLSVGTPVQLALPELLRSGGRVRDAISARVVRNLNSLKCSISDASPFRILAADGGWYAVLEAPRIRTEEEWVLDLLDRKNVLVQPGYYYDFDREAFLILSLLPRPEVFDTGVEGLLNLSHTE